MKNILFLIATTLCITSCSKNLKKTIGLTETLPDEYQSVRKKSLEIPPHFQLKQPENVKQSNLHLNQSEKDLLKDIESK